jgi:glycosyltransferase involved in cell wall biosynthesis
VQNKKASFLFVSTMNSAAWGGSEEAWFTAALELSRKDHKIGCAVYDWPAKEGRIRQLKESGCEVYLLPNKGVTKKNITERLAYLLQTKPAQRKILLSLPVEKYDRVVISQGGYKDVCSPVYSGWRQKLHSYCLLYHNYNRHYKFRAGKARLLREWMMRAEVNVFAAQEATTVIEAQLGFAVPHSATLINPITFRKPVAPAPYPALQDRYQFVMLAAFDVVRKGQDRLIEVLSGAKWKERNWELQLFGNGKDREMIRSLIAKHDMQDRIFIREFSNDVPQVLSQSHLLLQLTHQDAMPLSVVEAMASARPAVVSAIGDMPVWIKEGITGFVSPDMTIDAVDAALERAWNRRSEWEAMGKKAFTYFSQKYPEDYGVYFLNLISAFSVKR